MRRLPADSLNSGPRSGRQSAPANRLGRAFRLFTLALIGGVAATLVFGAMHVSSEPTILGRYSPGYFAILLALATALVALVWLLAAPRPTPLRWAGNLYALLASTVLAMAVAEIGLRAINPWGMELFSLLPYHMQGMVDHPQLGYAHPRSVEYRLGNSRVKLNSHGQRDDELPLAKPAGERRILVLGDSVTFGWGVDQGEDFPARLEALLRAENGSRWQVINAGVNGYNSEQEATYLAAEGIRFEPDIVLLVYVSNDVDPVIEPNAATWRRHPTWPSSLPELMERARSLSWLYQMTRLSQRMQEIGEPGASAQGPRRSITVHPNWPASFAALQSIAARCAERGIPFLVARLSGSDEEFTSALAAAGIDSLSLGPASARVPAPRQKVSRIDPHPSAEAHREFAVELLSALRERNWLATTPPR